MKKGRKKWRKRGEKEEKGRTARELSVRDSAGEAIMMWRKICRFAILMDSDRCNLKLFDNSYHSL